MNSLRNAVDDFLKSQIKVDYVKRRQAIDRLRAYYGVIGRAADEIADYAEKQQFLKAIYDQIQAWKKALVGGAANVFGGNQDQGRKDEEALIARLYQ